MLEIFHSSNQLNKAQLRYVYEQSILKDGTRFDPSISEDIRFHHALEDFYEYLDFFLKDEKSFYAVWTADGAYVAALRIEGYKDGYLLSGLETAFTARHKGYATAIVRSIQEYLSQFGRYRLYSHVDKKNLVSLRLHSNCGFNRILEHAVYLDGSVTHKACTLCYVV